MAYPPAVAAEVLTQKDARPASLNARNEGKRRRTSVSIPPSEEACPLLVPTGRHIGRDL